MEEKLSECFNCKQALPDIELSFCPYCACQVKCKSCNRVLLHNAKVCVGCGVRISGNDNGNINVIDYEQKGDYKKLHSSFSNEVGNTFAETIANIIGVGIQYKKAINPFLSTVNKQNNTKQLNGNNLNNKKTEVEDAIVIDNADMNDLLLKHFQVEEGKLKLTNSRLKHSGKLDQAIRLTILTLYAYEQTGEKQIEKSVLLDILASAKLYDANFRKWFAKCDEILKNDTKVELSVPGREVSKAILAELADENVVKGTIKFSKNGRANRRYKKNETSNKNDSDNVVATKRKQGAVYYFDLLIKENYFSQRRKLGEIIEYLKVKKAETFKPEALSTPLKRMIKSEKLKREKNSEGQYEYFI